MRFYVVCAWCGKLLRIKEYDGGDSKHAISHSICECCKARVQGEADEFFAKKPETIFRRKETSNERH